MREREDGAMITEAVETVDSPDDGAGAVVPAAMSPAASEQWNAWLSGHLDLAIADLIEATGKEFNHVRGEVEDALLVHAKRIMELELKLATAMGAIDVLRGRGLPGGFNVKGTYNATATYVLNDVIACDGGSFVALKDQPGPCPCSDWQRLAGPGRRGHRGPRGFDGAPGVDAPRWTGVSFNPEALSFTAKMSDGSLGPTISLASIFASVAVDARSYSVVLSLRDGAELRFSLADLFKRFFEEMGGAQR